jgi:hypothetical protein
MRLSDPNRFKIGDRVRYKPLGRPGEQKEGTITGKNGTGVIWVRYGENSWSSGHYPQDLELIE